MNPFSSKTPLKNLKQALVTLHQNSKITLNIKFDQSTLS